MEILSKPMDPAALVGFCGLILSAFTFWLGQRFALGRDKRIEWNELTATRYHELRNVIAFGAEDVDLVASYVPFCQRRGFRKALARYQDACRDAQGPYDPATGTTGEVDPSAKVRLCSAAKVLLGYYRRR